MKAGLVTSAVRRNGCAAYAIRLGKIRLLMTPYGAGKGRLFAQSVAGTTPTEAEVEDRPAGVGQMRLRETCRCARTGATYHARRLACPR